MSKEDTTAILDIAYKEVAEKLKTPISEKNYKVFMAGFMQSGSRHDVLFSPIPGQIYYNYDDINRWFTSTGIDKNIIKKAIENTYYFKIPNFNPRYAKNESTIGLCCMVRYYLMTKNQPMLNLACINIAFSGNFWSSIFSGRFPYTPAQHIMEYVVNQMMNNKYELIKSGTVLAMVQNITNTWIETYKNDKFKDFTDYDVQYLVQQLHTRIASVIQNIATLYYKAYENKDNILTYDSDDVSEDNFRTADNDTAKLAQLVNATVTEITTKYIDKQTIVRSSNSLVKPDELTAIFESLIDNKANIPLIEEFITLTISLYFNSLGDDKERTINDISFISFSIKPTPNTKDKYAMRKKELMEQMLLNNSEDFARRRNRAATESAYFKAFNAYIALTIQRVNKK